MCESQAQSKKHSKTLSQNKQNHINNYFTQQNLWDERWGGRGRWIINFPPLCSPSSKPHLIYIPGWLQTCNLLASAGTRACLLSCWLRIILLLYSARLRMAFISLIPIYLSTNIYFSLIETFDPTQLLPMHQIQLFVLLYTVKYSLSQRRKTGIDPRTIITYHPYNQ